MTSRPTIKEIKENLAFKKLKDVMSELHSLFEDRKITLSELCDLYRMYGFKDIKEILFKERLLEKEKFFKNFKITDLPKVGFFYTRQYLMFLMEKGLSKESIRLELYNLWEEGVFSGFDYRFAIEALGEEVDESFIEEAKKIGRYE
ncbi:MAG: hypothetical protein ACI311_06990 [Bacilli bacterium]